MSSAVALRAGLAFIWLATGLGVLSPYYRDLGAAAEARLGLPAWPMFVACAGEVLLGLWVLSGRAADGAALVQAALIVGFTLVLGVTQPDLLAHPFGVLTKNVPLLCLVGVVWLVGREGWSPRAVGLLRGGVASVWLLEGLLPNLLFPADELRAMVEEVVAWPDAATVLRVGGAVQLLIAVATLLLRSGTLRLLLAVEAAALVSICMAVTRHDPMLWLHPFGPLTKNVPILVGVLVLRRVVDTGPATADNHP